MDSHEFETWLEIADEVNTLIREYGREQFLIQTQQAASDYEAACKDYESREKQRFNLLEKNGVLEGVENQPDPPDDNWVVWEKTVRGSLKVPKDFEPPSMQPQLPDVPDEIRGLLPTRNFTDQQYTAWIPYKKEFDAWRRVNNDSRKARLDVVRLVKERGFPNDTQCDYVYKYMFNLLCLIPDELSPDEDPKNRDWPLPVQRELTLAEKFAVLAAVHAAHWMGAANIEPWGTNLPGVPKEQFKQASWYEILLYTAKELDVLDEAQIRFVGDLLADVESELLKDKVELNTTDQNAADHETSEPSESKQSPKTTDEKPIWDKATMTLTFDKTIVREFSRNAKNCFLVLDTFQEFDWPETIQCPIPKADSETRHRVDRWYLRFQTIRQPNARLHRRPCATTGQIVRRACLRQTKQKITSQGRLL